MKNRKRFLAIAVMTAGFATFLLACGGGASSVGADGAAAEQRASIGLDRARPERALEVAEADFLHSSLDSGAMATALPAPMAASAARSVPASEPAASTDGRPAGAGEETLQTAQRKVISVASLSIEVELVEPAIGQARAIAESLGGFVEQLSSSGGANPPQADLTVRVPQPQFFRALERIEALGEVQSRSLDNEDVTEEFIDLSARLNSSQREEQSLLSLLERSGSVTEILAVERELSRVRAEVERLQGRLNFVERLVALATIRLSLFPPGERPTDPPVASFTLDTSNVDDRVARLKGFVAGRDGEVDEVLLLTREDREQANVTFRVFSQDFDQTVAFIQAQGGLRHRELRERINLSGEETPRAKYPDARIEVSYLDEAFDFQPWLLGSILLVGAALIGMVAYLMRLAYRRGRLRGRFF